MTHRARNFAICLSVLTLAPLVVACPGGSGGFLTPEVPVADMINTTSRAGLLPVRGRIIEEDEDEVLTTDTTALEQASQEEIENALVDIEIVTPAGERLIAGPATADEEGYIEDSLDIDELNLPPGRYRVDVILDGETIGSYRARLLAETRSDPVVRSDVDLTYLNTDFMSNSGIAGLLTASPEDRDTLPAMEQVYPALRGDDERPVTFLSGSPRFFKRVIEGKMKMDGVEQDGLVLKPFKDIVATNVGDLDFDEVVPELKEQIGYKLSFLLILRAELPTSTPEILMGDDSEADVVVYVLYARFLRGELDVVSLVGELTILGVTSDWIDLIRPAATALEGSNATPPVAIYINETGVGDPHYPVEEHQLDDVVRYHKGAWPLALDLYEEGFISDVDVTTVKARLMALGVDEATLDEQVAASPFVDPTTAAPFR